MISASITVTRIINDEEVDIDVEVAGQSEYFGSANPYERGTQIADWSVQSPSEFDLTKEEEEWAVEALEANL
jgi:hypothetical protein